MVASEQAVVTGSQLDTLCINTIRTLAIDAVQQANSGHPGAPMGLAPVTYCLWQEFLRYDPEDPKWLNRDRFVLSNGHASMLLYAMLYLAGVREVNKNGEVLKELAIPMEEIKRFRQLGSRTPGHPESHLATGVETTTGPLGQGYGNSVGMAMAQRWLAGRFNRDGAALFDYRVYALGGDGDMMEGVSSEAASLAGHLKLANLCWIYDNNTVTIEGHTELAFSESVAERFRAYGWQTLHVADANDTAALAAAIEQFKRTQDRPTLIVVDSVIGYGSPNKHNSAAAHGEPLGVEEIRLTKKAYGWPEDSSFLVPDDARSRLHDAMVKRAAPELERWEKALAALSAADPARADELRRMRAGEMPDQWTDALPDFKADAKGMATRESSGKALNGFAAKIPWLLGGAADLAPSTKTKLTFDGAGSFEAGDYTGRNLHFGIREHAMGAIANGMALSYLRPFTATFLIFSDYMKPPMRLAALMEVPTIFVFTHDSIGLGEDGPTHQSIEQLVHLRAIPGMITLRPGDANEAIEAWKIALAQTRHPVSLILSRQPLPTFDRSVYAAASGTARGAYVLADAKDKPAEVILIGTGSEVSLCVKAYEQLKAEGIAARVVSMPSWELFESQSAEYRESVLPAAMSGRVAVEQAGPIGWDRYVGAKGAKVVMHSFGASAPIEKLQARFGFTVENVVKVAKEQAQQAQQTQHAGSTR